MMWWDGGWAWWGWLVTTAVMLLFWGLVAWAVVMLVRYLGDRERGIGDQHTGTNSAEAILAERFACGEIDSAEYRRRLDDLRQAGRAA
jgi:putative membrane protein